MHIHPYRNNKRNQLKNYIWKFNEIFDIFIGTKSDWDALQEQRKIFVENKEKYGFFCHSEDYDVNGYFDFIEKIDSLIEPGDAKRAFRSAIIDNRLIDIEHLVERSTCYQETFEE